MYTGHPNICTFFSLCIGIVDPLNISAGALTFSFGRWLYKNVEYFPVIDHNNPSIPSLHLKEIRRIIYLTISDTGQVLRTATTLL